MDELLEQFVLEGRELVQQASEDVLAMAEGSTDPSRIDSALRAIHTLKGSAGLFDLAPLGSCLHAAEDVVTDWRAAGQAGDAGMLSLLLDCLGTAGSWIEEVARTETLPAHAAARSQVLVAALRAGMGGQAAAAIAPPEEEPDWLSQLAGADEDGRARSAVRYEPAPGCFFVGDDPLALLRQVPELLALRIVPQSPWSLPDYDPFACNLVIFALSAAPVEAIRALFRFLPDQARVIALSRQPAASAGPAEAQRTLRVPVERIDALAHLVGELFIAKNRLSFAARSQGAEASSRREMVAAQAELDRLTGFLHRAVMGLRLVPLDQSFRRLPLLVRETAARLGREIGLTMHGTEVQADKGTVDALFEPLLHVLRNAADHGIEPPQRRIAAGKPARGNIVLQAALEGGQVVVQVSDDGAGIDPVMLRETAVRRGLLGAEKLAGMDEAALLDLVFLPGFSTAAQVTQTSGRGVGMDAVRMAIHALGGQVGIARAPSGGTVVRMTVPQSVSVASVLTVFAGGTMFGVPVAGVSELARIRRDRILPVGDGQAFVLRQRTIPLLDLATLLGRPGAAPHPVARILLVGEGDPRVGIEVDGFGARLEVVLRPLPALLSAAPGMRGSALLGDGTVLLVLELSELLR
jgi:two-component system chemotaxis sensor kinase CheA